MAADPLALGMPALQAPGRILVTGSAGHLGEALVRTLRALGHQVVGLDRLASAETDVVGAITDAALVQRCMQGVRAVLHTATLHKPHVVTHGRQAFVDTNISGTLTLLEAAAAAGVQAFVFTSTTSIYGDALAPAAGAPAAWITEDVAVQPKNIYGVTKASAEALCRLVHRQTGMPTLVLRTSRFFPEADDDARRRQLVDDANLKLVELLHRRADLHDIVSAHLLALGRAAALGFDTFVISATSPFQHEDLPRLRGQAAQVLRERVPAGEPVLRRLGWRMLDDIDRVYVNQRARSLLGWQPRYDFAQAIHALAQGHDPRSPLARSTRSRGYHPEGLPAGGDGPYPVAPAAQPPAGER